MTAALRIFPVAFGAGLLGTLFARWAAKRLDFVSRPNPIVRQHTRAVAYMGGLGVFLGYVAAITYPWSYSADVAADVRRFVTPAFLFLLMGICDDLKALPAKPKFALQLGAASVAVYAGNHFTVTGIPLADSLISGFWILTLVNAYNFVDVCDGLATGVSAIAFAALALRGGSGGIPWAACGAALGFLVFNFPPAAIFLGDAGSHLVGFLVAAFSMSAFGSNLSWPRFPEMLLISGVPLFELVFITLIRLRKGIPWWKGSPDHFALRLQAAGMTRLQADLCGWLAAIVMTLAGVSLKFLSVEEGIACIAVVLLALVAGAAVLLKWDVTGSAAAASCVPTSLRAG